MTKLILYHGSNQIVNPPIYGKGSPFNDYGLGFYCTENVEISKEWACNEGIDGYSNRYELETKDLTILDLSSSEYNILNWLAILVKYRQPKILTPLAKMGKDYLLDNFLIDVSKYDLVIGYRADDSYFSFVRSFLSNQISLRQLSLAMNLGELGKQVVLISKRAFDSIKFIDYSVVSSNVYYPKRKLRDEKAREDFQKQLDIEDFDGIYIRDIIKEGIKQNDLRL